MQTIVSIATASGQHGALQIVCYNVLLYWTVDSAILNMTFQFCKSTIGYTAVYAAIFTSRNRKAGIVKPPPRRKAKTVAACRGMFFCSFHLSPKTHAGAGARVGHFLPSFRNFW